MIFKLKLVKSVNYEYHMIKKMQIANVQWSVVAPFFKTVDSNAW